jgi:UDP-N-acetylglucosamine 2-epimerase (non-hydrolysing)
VNIGDRQTGRVKSSSILDTPCKADTIAACIRYAIDHKDEPITDTPYYKPNTAENYYRVTKQILAEVGNVKYKEFYDIPLL